MTDHEKIQGDWAVVAGEHAGQPFPDDLIPTILLSFRGDTLTTQVGRRTTTFRFVLDPASNPAAIDLDLQGAFGRGIYRLQGDALTIVHGEVGSPRPTLFENDSDSPLTVMRLTRRKTSPP